MGMMKRGISLAVCGALGVAVLSAGAIIAAHRTVSVDTDGASVRLARSSDAVSMTLPDGRRLEVYGAQGRAYLSDATRIERLTLPEVRQDASFTVMPTGQVLLWGGTDAKGRVLDYGQWFDPTTRQFVRAANLGLPARAGHTLTVLSDGHLLLAGGWSGDGVPTPQALVWDVLHRQVAPVEGNDVPRYRARAVMEADGAVRIEGGVDDHGFAVRSAMRFDPASQRLVAATDAPRDRTVAAVTTLPGAEAADTPLRGPLSLRFAEPVNLRELAAGKAVKLLGPNGIVDTKIVGAEHGRLAFVQLPDDLYPGARYTLFVQGLHTASGRAVPYTAVGFTTTTLHSSGVSVAGQGGRPVAPNAADSSAISNEPALVLTAGAGNGAQPCAATDVHSLCREHGAIRDGAWYPGQDNAPDGAGGHWRLYHARQELPDTRTQEASLAKNATALIGQVRRIDETPVANVEVSIGGRKVRTDGQGVFVLDGLSAGRQELFVDGRTASHGDVEYGRFPVGADIKAGEHNRMPFVMYLPRVLARDKITIPSPTTQEVVLKHPEMPGLELHIPAGTIFKDREGKVLTELAVVPTPVDHAPFPLPANFPMYFTIQPGDAVVQGLTPEAAQGIRVVYPNYGKQPPRTAADFWDYDIKEGWQMYGAGQVTADAQHLAPDPGVRIVWALGAGASADNSNGPGPRLCNGESRAQPVDLQTGIFFHEWTDLAVRDVVPLALTRAYRTGDTQSHAFGVGADSNFGLHLYSNDSLNTMQLVMPCGEGIKFNLVSGSLTWPFTPSTVWEHTSTNSSFYGATLQFLFDNTADGAHWILTLRDGTQMAFTRHTPNQMVWMQDRFGNALQLSYNAGLLDRVVSPSGRSLSFTYGAGNYIASVADHTGRKVTYDYNTAGALGQVTFPDGTTEQYTYDSNKRLLTMQDRRGHVWVTNEYDSNGRMAKQTFADNTYYQFAYALDTNQQVTATTITDPNGSKEYVAFDPVSKYPLTDTWAYGTSLAQTLTYVRQPSGLVDSVTDALGRKTTYGYDNSGNVTRITRLADTAQATTYQYSYTPDYNQVASITDPLNHATTFTYTNGCLSQMVDPLGHATTTLCNGAGQPTAIEDALGHLTTLSYQGYDLQSITDALSRTTTLTTDALGRLVATKDPLGNVTLKLYDTNDRVVKSIDGLNQATQVDYDGNGNATLVTLPSGKTIGSAFDDRNRRVTRTDALNQVESWTYDGMGHRLSHVDRKQQATLYTYDSLGRRTLTTYADGSGTQATYDAGNRLTELLDTSTGSLSWGYDDLNRVTQAVTPQGTVGYSYDGASRRIGMTPASQAAVVYQYDDANRLLSITQGTEVVQLGYDDANRRTNLTLPNGVFVTYGYDNANQLTGLVYTQGNGTKLGDLTYGYDMDGHIVAQGGSWGFDQLSASTAQVSAFDENNRQTSFDGTTLSYDANGNLTSDGTNNFVWNARNQLTQVLQGGSSQLTFAYDALGRRVSKAVGASAPMQYLYDGDNAVQEAQGAAVNPVLSGLGVDEHFARNDVTGRIYFLSDILRSTIGLTGGAGELKQRYSYDPYGNMTQTDTSTGFTNPYQYTGREADTSALYYYRARYYSPGMGRFISEDPAGFAGGQFNFYAYANNNPVIFLDPYGLWTIQLGLSLSGSLGPVSFVGSFGFALDSCGNFAAYKEAGFGTGVGEDVQVGLGVHATNGDTINDLNGPFVNASVSAGDGISGTVDALAGTGSQGQVVAGAGFTVGAGLGGAVSTSITNTTISPNVYHLW